MKKNDDKKQEKEEKEEQESGEDEKSVEEDLKLKQKIEELEYQYKRALADYQNLQKRSEEDRRSWSRLANKELLLNLLPVLDTLMLAEKHIQNEGLKVSVKHFVDVLENEGVKRIEAKDKEFNAETMECVGTSDGEDGKVLEDVRAGYMIHDKLLRPAQVLVGKNIS